MMILHANIGQNNHNREKTAFKNQSMCLRDSVCVHYVVQEFVHPKFFALVCWQQPASSAERQRR